MAKPLTKTVIKVVIMIDTILLKVPHPHFSVTRYEMFQPHAKGLFQEPYLPFNGQPYVKCINNPTKKDIEQGNYKPRLTIVKRIAKSGFAINLHIELSLPKLMHGNNFDELNDSDLEEIRRRLSTQLLHMGVHVSKEHLLAAPVYAVHYSKNIVFDDYTTASLILNALEKIKLNRQMDLNATDFRNQGEAVRYYAKSHEFVMYDKVADLNKSKDRAIEKTDRGHNLQMNIFEAVRSEGKPLEVIRLELRLKSRQKMKQVFARLGIDNDLTFASLFSQKLSQKLLQHQWDSIYKKLMPVLMQDLTISDQFELIAKQRPDDTPMRVLAMTAISTMKRAEGHRKVVGRFKGRYSERTMQRLYKDIEGLNYQLLNRAAPFDHITQVLCQFTPLRMAEHDVYLSHTPQ